MSKWAKWTDEELMRLGFLIQAGFSNPEIAEQMGKSKAGVQIKAHRIWGGNSNYKNRITKHKHLRPHVMAYFVNHTAEETMNRFKLNKSEFKSVMTVSYRDPKYAHLRKDKRNRNSWSAKELKFLLQHAGLRPRAWIGKKLKRGNGVCIKERLQTLGLSSRTLQGITLSQFRRAFGQDPAFYLQTDAGPGGGLKTSLPARWKIVPWVWLDQELKAKRIKAPSMFRKMVSTHAQFQEWIFEGNALQKMKRIIKHAKAPA